MGWCSQLGLGQRAHEMLVGTATRVGICLSDLTQQNRIMSKAQPSSTARGCREHERHIARVCHRDLRQRGERWAGVSREMGQSCSYADFDFFI